MGRVKPTILAAIFVAIVMQETMGFVRVGREEWKRDKSLVDETSHKHIEAGESEMRIENDLGKLLQRKVANQLALMRFILDAYNRQGSKPYLVSSKKGKGRRRDWKKRIAY